MSSVRANNKAKMSWHHRSAVATAILFVCGCQSENPSAADHSLEEPTATALPVADLSADEKAMQTVFGKYRQEPMQIGETGVIFRSGKLIELDETFILVASGVAISAAHPDPGYLGLWYLRQSQTGFEVQMSFPGVIRAGTFGDPPDWTVRTDLGPDAVIAVEGFGQWFGHAYTCTTLFALRPSGPRQLTPAILTHYQFRADENEAANEPSENIVGKIAYNSANNRIAVTYTGTTSEVVYFRNVGGAFRAPRLRPELDRC